MNLGEIQPDEAAEGEDRLQELEAGDEVCNCPATEKQPKSTPTVQAIIR